MAISAAKPTSDPGQPPVSLLYAVKQVELAIRARLDDLLKPAGITVLQYTALTVLERHDGLSAAELARRSFVTAQSMADMVGSLESRDLIRRERNPRSRRERLIFLTGAGRQLLADYLGAVTKLEHRMVADLTPRQASELRRALASAWHALS